MTEATHRSEKMSGWRHLLLRGRSALAPWLLSLFLALGPVYWLPGISMKALQRFDWGIFLVALALVFGAELHKGRRPFPTGLLGPLGFGGILLLWLPGLHQASDSFRVIVFVYELAGAGALFWCFYCIARDGGDVRAIFQRAFIIIASLAGIALVRALLNTPDWQFPCLWDYDAYRVGFSIRHTTWSAGLAVFVPAGALLFLPSSSRPLLGKLVGGVGIAALVGSQFVSGGRAGLLASLLVLGALMLLPAFRRMGAIVILAGLAISIPFLNSSCAKHLKLDRIGVPVDEYVFDAEAPNPAALASNSLDNFSTRRIRGYLLGLEKIRERPLLGHGLEQVLVDTPWSQYQTPIHNLWIKWAAYTGIAAPLLLMVMVMLILRVGRRLARSRSKGAAKRAEAAALGLILLSGLLISMLEIDIPIGIFQRTAIWWAAAGSLVGAAALGSIDAKAG